MIEKVGLKPGQHAIFDNYFGSVNLLDELASKRIAATCTLQEYILSGAPLNPRKLLYKKERGAIEEILTRCISVVIWKDNKLVSVVSNKLRSDPRKKQEDGTELKRNIMR